MQNHNSKILKFPLSFLILIFTFYIVSQDAQAAQPITVNFDINPKVVISTSTSTQFQARTIATMDIAEFNSTCGSNTNSITWKIYRNSPGAGGRGGTETAEVATGTQTVIRNAPNAFDFTRPFTLDTSNLGQYNNGVSNFYTVIYCPGVVLAGQLTRSTPINVTFGSANRIYGCIANDNKYACSPGNLNNCSDTPSCVGKPCIQIGSNLCGRDASTGITGQPGSGVNFGFTLTNPWTGVNSIFDAIDKITDFLLTVAVPIAVILIVYAGLIFLTSGGNTGKITQARTILWYTMVGFTVILIGKGFYLLIESVLNLGA